ncbi:hopanoid-associated sugar epimerase [Rhodopila sp.]|jgi:dihydroflavonol-4-reductase|uniref:hopanoid-associated sugar epimerase n=1 Tax=Rhodopila sp. TaxID=2480087 RepID=UPI002C0EBB2E|nr:hopanoid-associated sugar epimerase [Rhodopila sp.]HVZ07363.1 hopanoid-associated sugar epimerase [Rhodopila sp.]
MTSLVTGATGFVGSAVARALAARGHVLRLLARPGSDRRNLAGLDAEVVIGDLTDPDSLARAAAGCRYVIHVAADYRIWVPDPQAMLRANVDGAVAMVRAAMRAGAERIVHCSSVAALGQIGDGTPADETTPTNEADFVGIYKRSKFLAERAVLDLVRSDAAPVVVVNPAGPVGPRDIKPTPTGKMILDAAAGRMPAYIDTGLNIVHVDDVGEGHALALEKGRIGERYVLGGDNMLLRDILRMVAQVAHSRPPFIRLPEAVVWPAAFVLEKLAPYTGIPPMVTTDHLKMARKKMFYSSAKAMAELGYRPRPARQAIEDAVAWFRANGMLKPSGTPQSDGVPKPSGTPK